jgi:hypothetical protein
MATRSQMHIGAPIRYSAAASVNSGGSPVSMGSGTVRRYSRIDGSREGPGVFDEELCPRK